jgi:hypothetical protein
MNALISTIMNNSVVPSEKLPTIIDNQTPNTVFETLKRILPEAQSLDIAEPRSQKMPRACRRIRGNSGCAVIPSTPAHAQSRPQKTTGESGLIINQFGELA